MIEIVHTPDGQEHPYEQLPEERFPREPLAGETFTVGIATRPPGAAHSVRVHTRLDDTPRPVIEATQIVDWQPLPEEGVGVEYLERIVTIEQDIWHAQLVAPPVGQTLTYQIEADGQVGASYILRGQSWQSAPLDQLDYAPHESIPTQSTMHFSPHQTASEPMPNRLPALRAVEWLTDGQCATRVRLTFNCTPDEAFFGLGERFNALNQRGEILDVRVYEQYKSQGKRTYIPLPFLLSSEGYGVYVKSSRWMQFDLAATQLDVWLLEADLGLDETLDLTWLTGDSSLDIISQFTLLTGPPKLPPLWTFGLWMSGNEWNSQACVEHEVAQSFAHGITPSALVIEAWSDETTFYIWNDAEYDAKSGEQMLHYGDFTFPAEGKWPDPKGMIDQLHTQGIRVLLWQLPVFKAIEEPHPQHDADRAYFEMAGLGVHDPDGSLHTVRPFWFRHGYIWDVTNPTAREWWLNKRAYLLEEMGIDGFKTDGGEHMWSTKTRFAGGRRGDEVWNLYPQIYTDAFYTFSNKKRNGDAVMFSRAGFVGSQSGPAHWAGDENSTWDAYRHSIFAGLSAGISGIPFWGWDLGGFSGEIPSAELYLRGAAMAAFCPIMQYHSEFNQHRDPCHDRTPWNIQARSGDERVIPAFRFFVNVRHALMPYIWQEAQHAAATGEPLMRALALWDSNASPYQYMFGRDLLVCPVVEEGAQQWDAYLPEGEWIDFWTHERYSGKQTITVDVPLDRIPVYVRAGAEIPVVWGEHKRLGDPVPLSAEANATLHFA
jgi:alpha-glucosidase (family GH31 glycosyl hydrolase)